jgi:HCOMODA/2-hydroxy-3-carboxy-muconic semialdehyde decarboxylase
MTSTRIEAEAVEQNAHGVPSVSVEEPQADGHGVLRQYRANTPFIQRQGTADPRQRCVMVSAKSIRFASSPVGRWWIRLALVTALAALFGLAEVHAQTQASGDQGSAAVIDDIVTGSRVLADFGVLDGFGHVSARDPKNPNHFLMSRSLAPALVTAGDIMEFDLDGNAVDARGRALFLERFIHAAIYRARPDVMSVVHTHSPGVIPFTISQVPLRPVFRNAAFLAAGAPVWDIRKDFGDTDMLVRDEAIGRSLAQTLGDRSVVLMRGHGDVTVGSSIKVAAFRAYYADVNARLQSQAVAFGGPVDFLTSGEGTKADAMNAVLVDRIWDLWKMRVSVTPTPAK